MPSFRRWSKSKLERNPESSFKLLAALLVITFYLLIKEFQQPTVRVLLPLPPNIESTIQYESWNGTGKEQKWRAKQVKEAMSYTFRKYRENAWGQDDILPVSGGNATTRNGWGAFIVDSASTLALMGLWDELQHSVEHILAIEFEEAEGLVDPFETTIRYLGGMISLIDLYDAGIIPQEVMHVEVRDLILIQAVTLAGKLAPAYDTPTNLPWPRVDFETNEGEPALPFSNFDEISPAEFDHPVVGPARAGSSILEYRTLTRLTGEEKYITNATLSWAPLVWSKWIEPLPGMVDAPIDIMTKEPAGRSAHWDAGHDSYYEYLLKITLLAPPKEQNMDAYRKRFLTAAYSLRQNLSSRSAPAPEDPKQHLFIGHQEDKRYENLQSHLACFAPGTLLMASKAYNQTSLRTFALALLEGCHHTYAATPTGVGAETWAWIPKFGYSNPVFIPHSDRQRDEAMKSGIWSLDPTYKGRPEYVESLFYAWRITGEQRYRDWAWDAFAAIDKHCKAPFGYAQLADVYSTGKVEDNWIDMQESFWAAETLKYLWLTFTDVEKASLDEWVFNTEGHPLRMIR